MHLFDVRANAFSAKSSVGTPTNRHPHTIFVNNAEFKQLLVKPKLCTDARSLSQNYETRLPNERNRIVFSDTSSVFSQKKHRTMRCFRTKSWESRLRVCISSSKFQIGGDRRKRLLTLLSDFS